MYLTARIVLDTPYKLYDNLKLMTTHNEALVPIEPELQPADWPTPRLHDVTQTFSVYGITYGTKMKRVIDRIEGLTPIIDRDGTGQVGIKIDALDTALCEKYVSKETWEGVGSTALQHLNILVDHYRGEYLDGPTAQLADQTVNGQPVILGKDVATFGKQIGIKVGAGVIQNVIAYFGSSYLEQEYQWTCRSLEPAEYTADDIQFRRPLKQDATIVRLAGLASTNTMLRRPVALSSRTVMPQLHYVLLRYMDSLNKQGLLPEHVEKLAPNHPSISEANRPQHLDAAEFRRRIWSGEVIAGKPGRYYDAGLDGVRRLAGEGVYTPLTSLFDTFGNEGPKDLPLALSKARLGAFLNEMLSEGAPDLATKLMDHEDMQRLIRKYLAEGAHEDLPHAEYTTADWAEQPAPAINLKRVVSFSELLGLPITAQALNNLIDRSAAQKLAMPYYRYCDGKTYQERGITFVYNSYDPLAQPGHDVSVRGVTAEASQAFICCPKNPQTREAFVLFKYLKALYQQGACEQTPIK